MKRWTFPVGITVAETEHNRTDRLQEMRAQARLRAIKAQLAAGFILCALVQTDIGKRRIDKARNLMQKLRASIRSVRHHLQEPNHVPPHNLPKIRNELRELEKRILEADTRLTKIAI